MLAELQNVTLTDNLDSWLRQIGKDGVYTVGDTHRHIDVPTIWNKNLPRKVNVFIWRLCLDRLPNRFNLSRCSLDIDSIVCPVCNMMLETSSHYFFTCDLASSIWRAIRIWCDISTPPLLSCADWITWIESLQGSKQKKIRLFVIVGTLAMIKSLKKALHSGFHEAYKLHSPTNSNTTPPFTSTNELHDCIDAIDGLDGMERGY
ncbi:RNA-directed DNA polymerase, eukaryota [Tanacetum coccineum]|uniref:RNA-directed DNA polymerase, eukaryota n=1 Tax=Tanacetum coccineum TaxID=301880 RepID=A0ABQ5DQF8_9ASTR